MNRDGETRVVSGRELRLSHLEKVYWPDDGITKGDLLDYYHAVAPVLLRHLADRPVTVRVFPEGIRGPAYYRRDRPTDAPAWLRGSDYLPETTGRVARLILVDDEAGLAWLANRGAIEFHAWASRLARPGAPDQAIFDLDPGEGATFDDVRRVAGLVRRELQALGLSGYPKTSGSRGIHVYVPLAPGPGFADVRAWVAEVAIRLAATYPDLVAAPSGATHRGSHVTIDAAQNSIARNTAAPYTVRALPNAPVSAPLTWDEVDSGSLMPSDLTLRTMPARLEARGDLFASVLQSAQPLPAK